MVYEILKKSWITLLTIPVTYLLYFSSNPYLAKLGSILIHVIFILYVLSEALEVTAKKIKIENEEIFQKHSKGGF